MSASLVGSEMCIRDSTSSSGARLAGWSPASSSTALSSLALSVLAAPSTRPIPTRGPANWSNSSGSTPFWPTLSVATVRKG
eukprot:5543577-Alexandrium_andersonii.AAC.1